MFLTCFAFWEKIKTFTGHSFPPFLINNKNSFRASDGKSITFKTLLGYNSPRPTQFTLLQHTVAWVSAYSVLAATINTMTFRAFHHS